MLERYNVTLLHDVTYKKVRCALDLKMKRSTEANLVHKQAKTVTLDVEEKMWEAGVLGSSDLTTLLNTNVRHQMPFCPMCFRAQGPRVRPTTSGLFSFHKIVLLLPLVMNLLYV